MKSIFYQLFFLFLIPTIGLAQSKLNHFLFEETSEMGTKIIGYQQDRKAIKDFYSPYQNRGFYPEIRYVRHSPEQRKRLIELNEEYLRNMLKMDFVMFSVYGKVDYLMLKKEIDADLTRLEQEESEDQSVVRYLPFAADIYAMEKQRRRGNTPDAPAIAGRR